MDDSADPPYGRINKLKEKIIFYLIASSVSPFRV